MTPAFQGEVQFRRYSDTSTQGQQVVFAVQDRDALESFIGKEGKRFMAVLVEIGDDDQPVKVSSEKAPSKGRGTLGDLCWRAVQWCDDPEFLGWLKLNANVGVVVDASYAKSFILGACRVSTRKELDTDMDAAHRFNTLIRAPYQKYLIARGLA